MSPDVDIGEVPSADSAPESGSSSRPVPEDGAGPSAASFRVMPVIPSATSEFLRAQSEAPPRTLVQRFFGRSPLTVHGRSWLWAALGEMEVARAVARLGEPWSVVHSIPIRDHESEVCIDHLVVGPGGVFAVRAASFSGQDVWISERSLVVAGHSLPHMRQTAHAVGEAERALSQAAGIPVSVVGIIAIVEPESVTVSGRPRDVVVLASSQLARWISRRPRVLEPAQVAAIAGAANDDTTWAAHPVSANDSEALVALFEPIRREVVAARLVRRLWAASGAVAVAGGTIMLALTLLTGA